MASGDKTGESVREEPAAYVEASDGGLERSAGEDRGHGCVGEARVDQEEDFGGEVDGGVGRSGALEDALDVMVGVEGWSCLLGAISMSTGGHLDQDSMGEVTHQHLYNNSQIQTAQTLSGRSESAKQAMHSAARRE